MNVASRNRQAAGLRSKIRQWSLLCSQCMELAEVDPTQLITANMYRGLVRGAEFRLQQLGA